MNNYKSTSAIHCKIHQDSLMTLTAIKQKINQGASVGIKAKYAEELAEEVTALMDCSRYDDREQDCVNCRLIAGLHKKVAELIIKAKSLSQ